jgi:enoyl-CoA hydratase/carnithine racemase
VSDDILKSLDGGVLTVTLNRPEKYNALTFDMYDAITDICSNVPSDGSVKAIVFRGAGGKAFAAGTDISLFRNFETPEQGIAYEKNADKVFTALERCPVPTIAAITGACTGGGAGIAACCDMRIATRSLKFGFPIARTLGNCLSAATLARLVGLMGEAGVIDLIYTSRLIEAEEALRIGLVNELVEDHDAVVTRSDALARQLAGHAPLTMRVTKELLRRLRHRQPAVEDDDLVGMVYTSADFREGLDAFLTKRKPNWQGR